MESVSKHCNLILDIFHSIPFFLTRYKSHELSIQRLRASRVFFQFVPDRCSIIVLFLFPWKKCLKKIVTASIKISSLCFFFFFFLRQILFKKNRYRTFFSFLAKILETSIEYFSLYFFKIAAKTLSRAEIENYRPSPSSKKIYLPSEIQLGIR